MDNQMNDIKIMEEFKTRRKRQLILSIPLIIGMAGIIMMKEFKEVEFFGIPKLYLIFALGTLFIFGIIFSVKNWRCPACSKYLGRKMGIRSCPKCGVKLQ